MKSYALYTEFMTDPKFEARITGRNTFVVNDHTIRGRVELNQKGFESSDKIRIDGYEFKLVSFINWFGKRHVHFNLVQQKRNNMLVVKSIKFENIVHFLAPTLYTSHGTWQETGLNLSGDEYCYFSGSFRPFKRNHLDSTSRPLAVEFHVENDLQFTPQPTLGRLILELPSSSFRDITLVVDNQEVNASKAILCSLSKKFFALFNGKWKDSTDDHFVVDDGVSYESFKIFIDILHGLDHYVDDEVKIALQLITLAYKYCVCVIAHTYIEYVTNRINQENVIDVLKTGVELGFVKLKTAAIEFINDRSVEELEKIKNRTMPIEVREYLSSNVMLNETHERWSTDTEIYGSDKSTDSAFSDTDEKTNQESSVSSSMRECVSYVSLQ